MTPSPQPQQPQQQVQPVILTEVKKLRNLADRFFQALCGLSASFVGHLLRSPGSDPTYLILFGFGCLIAIVFLGAIPPANREFTGLYRSGAIAVFFGAGLAFWDLLPLIPYWVWIGSAIAAICFISIAGRA